MKSQLVYECKQCIEDLYDLNRDDPTEVKGRVEHLLDADRFTCAKPEVGSQDRERHSKANDELQQGKLRFLAPQILAKVNIAFISLVACVLHFSLKSWVSGTYSEPKRFRGIEPKGMLKKDCQQHGEDADRPG